MNITFNNWLCKLVRSRYENGRVCLRLKDISTNAWVAMATVDLPHIELDQDEVIINNHGENAGIIRTLVKASAILQPHRLITQGNKCLDVCTLLVDMEDMPVGFSVNQGRPQ